MKKYQAVIIGAGPAGYEAALILARGGMQTLLIDRAKERIGGTCLNEGCIPTKAYLQSAEYLSKAAFFRECGVDVQTGGIDLQRLGEKTVGLKNEIRSGVVWLLDQAGVELCYGEASFADPHTIVVEGERIGFEHCIIATGSQSREVPELQVDGRAIVTNLEVFGLRSLPALVAIVGGGPIACEFATFFSAAGSQVTMIVRGERLLGSEDEDVSKALLRSFKKSGVRVVLSAALKEARPIGSGARIVFGGEAVETLECELVISAVGRVPNTQTLMCHKAGVVRDGRGYIEVDPAFRTKAGHIYAIGDCIDTPAFAHTAYAEAKVAARNILSATLNANTHLTPRTIFSRPQCASCGISETEAREKGLDVVIRKALFKVNAKSKILGDDSGFAKIIAAGESGRILGAVVIGNEATEIIHELLVAIEQKMSVDELSSLIHAHPTVSEIVRYLE